VFFIVVFCFQEWPEEEYPPYANGPGYVLSSDIAHYIVSEFEMNKLRVSALMYHCTFSLLSCNVSSILMLVHMVSIVVEVDGVFFFMQLFKMEDVSMGMWVEQFNRTKPVNYLHSFKFCQYGCVEGYYTAHYQSPRQMMCLWDKLQMQTTPECCNMR